MSLRCLVLANALVLLSATLWTQKVEAQETDGIAVEGLLSDKDFFHLASCGAAPGGACRDPVVRWPKRELTISLLPSDLPPPAGFNHRLSRAIDRAIDEINAVEAGIHLRRVPQSWADIRVSPSDIPEGEVLEDVPGFTASGVMGVGYVSYWWNDQAEITTASILISTTILDSDLQSVMLEELFQALGPRFDVESPAYEGVSILSQSSNETLTIAGQDARLLLWLYPPMK